MLVDRWLPARSWRSTTSRRRTAQLAAEPWRALAAHLPRPRTRRSLPDRPGTQDITAQVALDQLPTPDAVRTQAQFLQQWGIDDLVDEGRRAWEAAAASPTVAALTMRSRSPRGGGPARPDRPRRLHRPHLAGRRLTLTQRVHSSARMPARTAQTAWVGTTTPRCECSASVSDLWHRTRRSDPHRSNRQILAVPGSNRCTSVGGSMSTTRRHRRARRREPARGRRRRPRTAIGHGHGAQGAAPVGAGARRARRGVRRHRHQPAVRVPRVVRAPGPDASTGSTRSAWHRSRSGR